jgi:crotonobetainyl-CoA:carnitine CoA-transferase CaiB-like acyl-CoA transferase
MLADLGADVVKIEAAWSRGSGEIPAVAGKLTHLYPEDEVGERPWNREISFNKLNRGKRSVTLELDQPRGRELFLKLAATADVVIDNFSPRVMGKLGLDPEALHRVNPRLVCVSMPGFGSSGPYRDWLAFGPLIEAMSGVTEQMGYADGGPCRSGVAWPDPVTAMHAAAATVTALYERDATPERRGAVVEVPMLESMICFFGEEVLAAQARGAAAPRRGNRHPERAPQGVYPSAGADRWIAISVTTDDEWRALASAAGLADELQRAGFAERARRHDEIDHALASWTATHDADELARRLQSAGVIAAPVVDAERLVGDPQLAHDGFWVELEHPEVGRRRYPGMALRFSATPCTFRRPAPCLGQHNAEVLGGELGLSEVEIAELRAAGVIADRPPPGASFRKNAKKPAIAGAADQAAAATDSRNSNTA